MKDIYSTNKILRPLLQIIPMGLGSAVDVAIMQEIDRSRDARLQLLEERLKGLCAVIKAREYNRDYLVGLYSKMVKYVLETQQRQKIGLLANCLVNSDVVKNDKEYDLYEFGLNIIGQMTMIEIQALSIIHKLRGISGVNNSQEPQWKAVVETIVSECGVTKGEVKAITNVMEGKGLIVDFPTGLFPSDGYVETTGRVSEIGARVIRQILIDGKSD